jgi:mono/diheme cytochrome c family protein
MRPSLAVASAVLALAAVACATAAGSGGGGGSADAAGGRLYRGHCGSCHRLRDPGEQSRERWAWAVDRFGPRAHLSPEERQLVLGFLQARAKDASPAVTQEAR